MRGGARAIELDGVGSLRGEGRVDQLDVHLGGIGDAELYDLEARQADVWSMGTGDVEILVRDSLHASITGTGDVRYRGRPKDVSKSVAGTGSIKPD